MTGAAASRPPGEAEDFTLVQLIAMIVVVCTGFSSQMVMPLWVGAIIEHHAITEKTAGTIASTEFAAVAIVSVIVASQVHRLNARITVLIGLALLFAGNLMAAFVDTALPLTLCRIVTGAGKGMVVAIVFGMCAGSRHPTRTFAYVNASYAVFSTVFYLVVPPAIQWNGPAGAFLVMATVAVIGAIFMVRFPARRLEAQERANVKLKDLPVFGFLTLACLVFIWMAHGSVWTFLERLGGRAGMSVIEVGEVLSLGAFITIAGPLLARLIDTRFGNSLPVFAATVALIACVFGIVYAWSPLPYMISVPLFLLMALFTVPYLMGILSVADPSGRLAAVSSAAMTAGGSLGALTGGYTVEYLDYAGLAWVSGGLFVLVLAMMAVIAPHVRNRSMHVEPVA